MTRHDLHRPSWVRNRVRNAAVMSKIAHESRIRRLRSRHGQQQNLRLSRRKDAAAPNVAAPETVKLLWRETHRASIGNDSMRRWEQGMAATQVGAESSSEPIRNWQEEWHDERGLAGPRFDVGFW